MKINAYTTAIQNIHVPSSAVEKALKAAKVKKEEKHRYLRSIAIAASIVLVMVGALLIYGVFVAPVSQIILDSRESVTITLNSRGNVLSAVGYSDLSGKSAEEAVALIAEDMIESGALTEDENTLIIGVSDNAAITPKQLVEWAAEVFEKEKFDGCPVALSFEKNADARYHQSISRTCLIDLIHSYDSSLSVENLKALSSNDLCLLLKDIRNDKIVMTGSPSESAYIGFDGAVNKALMLSGFKENELSDMSVAYSIYHGKLIYLVRLNAGENSEAYFINALTGATEQAIKAPAKEIDKAVEEAIQTPPAQNPTEKSTYSAVVPTSAPVTQLPTVPMTETSTDEDRPPIDDPTDEPQSPDSTDNIPTTAPITPTQTPTTAESADYRSISITLKELSFVVLSPPENASAVSYQTLFEGQYFEPRKGEKINGGEVAVITNYSQLQAFLKKHPYAYTDKNGSTLKNTYTAEYFKTHYILVSACTVSDASYYTTVTELSSDGGMTYMENSLSYGPAHSGEFYCHTLSLYGVSRSAGIPESITVY